MPIFFLHALGFAAISIWFLAGAMKEVRPVKAAAQGAALLGIVGYSSFFILWLSRPLGIVALCAATIAVLLFIARKALRFGSSTWCPEIKYAVAAWYILSLGYTLLTFSVDNGAGSWLVNTRFWPAEWSSDNQIPKIIANALYDGRSMADGLIGGSWQVSDRPPLLYGILVLARIFIEPLSLVGTSGREIAMLYDITGAVANSLWVPVAAIGAMKILGKGREWVLVIVVISFLPFAIFNTIYIWPKLLGASFGLAAFLILQEVSMSETAQNRHRSGMLVGLLCSLAFLSHGGTIFCLLVVAAWYSAMHSRLALILAPSAFITAAVMVAPWSLWQKVVNPPGNALIKLAAAGTYGFDERDMGIVATAVRTYSNLGLNGFVATRLGALETMLGFKTGACGSSIMEAVAAPFTQNSVWMSTYTHRAWDFLYEVPSIGFWWSGLIPLVMYVGRSETKQALTMIGLGVSTLAFTALITLGCYVIHHQSYQAMLFIAFGLGLGVALGPMAFRVIITAACIVYTTTVWVVAPLRLPDAVVCWSNLAGFTILVFGVVTWWLQGKNKESIGQEA